MVYGRVYAIRSHQTTDMYIGSTTQPLCKRMSDHRRAYKCYLNKTMKYTTSVELLKYEDAYIELLNESEFESPDDLRKKEGEYQRKLDCVNKCIAGRTRPEYISDNKEQILNMSKKWYETNKEHVAKINKTNKEKNKVHNDEVSKKWRDKNKEHVAEKSKKWREENKEHVAEKNKKWHEDHKEYVVKIKKTKYTCECGSVICVGAKWYHENSKKHLAFLENSL